MFFLISLTLANISSFLFISISPEFPQRKFAQIFHEGLIMTKLINSIRKCFTQIPNAIAIDLSLSNGAVRVFLYMSGKPDDWFFNNRDIQKQLDIKDDATMSKYWKELINSGWVSRTPALNQNGKPSGYYNYVLHFQAVKPDTSRPDAPTQKNTGVGTMNKPVMVNPQLEKIPDYTNTESVTNTIITTHTNNIEQRLLNGAEWVRLADKNKIGFSEEDKIAIKDFGDEFFIIRSKKRKSITEKLILQELNKLHQYKTDGYNIVLLIQDSISYEGGFLFKTTPKYLIPSIHKSNGGSKPTTRPHLYDNPKYIISETPAEKNSLAAWIQSSYKDKINPKTNQPMTSVEIAIITAHNKRFHSQQKNNLGFYVCYSSWLDYILQNEVHSRTSLLDQPLDSAVTPTKPVAI